MLKLDETPGYANRTFKQKLNKEQIKTSIFSYLRMCPDNSKPNYIKASALNKNVILELRYLWLFTRKYRIVRKYRCNLYIYWSRHN